MHGPAFLYTLRHWSFTPWNILHVQTAPWINERQLYWIPRWENLSEGKKRAMCFFHRGQFDNPCIKSFVPVLEIRWCRKKGNKEDIQISHRLVCSRSNMTILYHLVLTCKSLVKRVKLWQEIRAGRFQCRIEWQSEVLLTGQWHSARMLLTSYRCN